MTKLVAKLLLNLFLGTGAFILLTFFAFVFVVIVIFYFYAFKSIVLHP